MSDEDVDISDLPVPEADISDLPVPPDSPARKGSWLGAAKGVGEAGLALGSGALRAITSAANDILPETGLGGPGARAEIARRIAQDPILNYQGGPEAQPILGALGAVTRPISQIASAIHSGIADIAGERAADIAGDVATLAPGLRGARTPLETEAAIEEGHPLTAAAKAETGRIGGFKQRGEALGLDLPEGGTPARHAAAAATNTPVGNAVVRSELQLPKNAPLSAQMLESARKQYVSPAYQAVRNVKEISLGPEYEKAIGEIDDYGSIKSRYRPPPAGTLTGDRAVELSKNLRDRANRYFASARQSGSVEAEDLGQAHWDAAQAVEDAVKSHLESTGQGKLAKDWDAARVYAAKTYSVQNALDGAGNVKVSSLKQQLMKGKPLSGDLETLANLGAQYPEAFKTTRLTTPAPSLVRRGAAALAPMAGAALGSFVGGGTGAGLGARAGESIGEKIVNP